MGIEVFNESGYDGVNEEALISVASYALGAMDVHQDTEVNISIVDLATMDELHQRWMGLTGPTDVMSFPMDEAYTGTTRPDAPMPQEAAVMLGDIILCPEFANKQAEKAGHDLGHELALLTVHGCLHLLGYDHIEPREEQRMFALQNELLSGWYDHNAANGIEFQPKPNNPGAFPSAADRAKLDELVPGGGIPAIGEPLQGEEPK